MKIQVEWKDIRYKGGVLNVLHTLRKLPENWAFDAEPHKSWFDGVTEKNLRSENGVGARTVREVELWLGRDLEKTIYNPIPVTVSPATIEAAMFLLEKHGYTVTKS